MMPTLATLLPVIATAVDQATDAIVITTALIDPPGPTIVYVNPAFCAMSGYAADEVLGRSPRMLHGPASNRAELDNVRRALEQEQPYRGEIINYRKDGSAYHLRWHMDPIRGEHGRVTHWVAIQRDVSDEYAATAERAQLLAATQAALAMRNQFLAVATHELRTPLTAVLGYASLLQDRLEQPGGDAQSVRLAAAVVTHASRLTDLIGRLLDVSRLAQGQFDMQAHALDLAAVVAQAVDDAQVLFTPETATRLEVQSLDIPVPVNGDALRLSEVLHNLLSNAVKYSAAGTPIGISLTIERDNAVVTISDQGIGIPAAARARLFEAYFRADNAGQQSGGFGIGLYVAHEIAMRHGGRLEVESTEGQGSTFRLILPLAERPR